MAFTQAGQRAVPLRGGGPDSAASTPDRRSNDRREQQPQQGESKDGISQQEEEPSELRPPKVAFILSAAVVRSFAPRFEYDVDMVRSTLFVSGLFVVGTRTCSLAGIVEKLNLLAFDFQLVQSSFVFASASCEFLP